MTTAGKRYADYYAGRITYDELIALDKAEISKPKDYGPGYVVSKFAEEVAAKRLKELLKEQEEERDKYMKGHIIQQFDRYGHYTKEWMERFGGTAYPEKQKEMDEYNEYMGSHNERTSEYDTEQKRKYDEERRKETEKIESQEKARLKLQKEREAEERERQARLFEENKREQARQQEHHQQQSKIRHRIIQRSRNRSNERFQRVKENDTIFNRAYNGK